MRNYHVKLKMLNLTSNPLGNLYNLPVIRRKSEVDDDARYSCKGSVVFLTPIPVLPRLHICSSVLTSERIA
jgi:hypothetical protein